MKLRPATQEDAEAIAHLHTVVAQAAFAGMFPQDYLLNHMPGERRVLWRERLVEGNDENLAVSVAEQADGTLAGFICFAFRPDDPLGTYFLHLYILPEQQGQGLANRLILHGIDGFSPHDRAKPLYLLVLEKNLVARRAYEKLGGIMTESLERSRGGRPPVTMLRFEWPSAEALHAAAAARLKERV